MKTYLKFLLITTGLFCAVFPLEALNPMELPDVLYMTPTVSVARFPEGRLAALVIRFDDSTPDHIDYAIPELEKRGLLGTFYVNAHRSFFQNRLEDWKRAAMHGHSIGFHGLNHIGAWNYEEAEYQVRESVRIIREHLYDGRAIPMSGHPGGWTRWGITWEQMYKLYDKYGIFREESVIRNMCSATGQLFPDLKGLVDAVIRNKSSQSITFHGVGPQGAYLVVPEPDFTDWLDYVAAAVEDYRLWVAPVHLAYIYQRQRDAAQIRNMIITENEIGFDFFAGFDDDNYTTPVTLLVRLPVDWQGQYTLEAGDTGARVQRLVPNVPSPGPNYDRLFIEVPYRDARYVVRRVLNP